MLVSFVTTGQSTVLTSHTPFLTLGTIKGMLWLEPVVSWKPVRWHTASIKQHVSFRSPPGQGIPRRTQGKARGFIGSYVLRQKRSACVNKGRTEASRNPGDASRGPFSSVIQNTLLTFPLEKFWKKKCTPFTYFKIVTQEFSCFKANFLLIGDTKY